MIIVQDNVLDGVRIFPREGALFPGAYLSMRNLSAVYILNVIRNGQQYCGRLLPLRFVHST